MTYINCGLVPWKLLPWRQVPILRIPYCHGVDVPMLHQVYFQPFSISSNHYISWFMSQSFSKDGPRSLATSDYQGTESSKVQVVSWYSTRDWSSNQWNCLPVRLLENVIYWWIHYSSGFFFFLKIVVLLQQCIWTYYL